MKSVNVLGLEGHSSENHGVKQHAEASNVSSEPRVTVFLDYFWCDVSRRPTLLIYQLSFLDESGDTEIANFGPDLTISFTQEHVVQFYVSVQDLMVVRML